MAGLLEKIFLGNVNEQGEVDQEGYDDETKSGLTKVTTENKSVSCFDFKLPTTMLVVRHAAVAESLGTSPDMPPPLFKHLRMHRWLSLPMSWLCGVHRPLLGTL
jgi:hypothetical protein